MRVFYADHAEVVLPEGHRFPMHKYRMIRDVLTRDGVIPSDWFEESPLAQRDELVRTHAAEYVDGFVQGSLRRSRLRRIGIPWSPEFVRRARASVGGTIAAARAA
ncbi:MAG: histone deacetylase, partial [Myxococcota bacterium]